MKRLMLVAVLFFAFANVADLWTSLKTPEFPEGNHFARNLDYSFNLNHAIKAKLIASSSIFIIAIALYIALCGRFPELAAFGFAFVLFYYGGDILLNAATPNFMLYLDKYFHWYVPDRLPE